MDAPTVPSVKRKHEDDSNERGSEIKRQAIDRTIDKEQEQLDSAINERCEKDTEGPTKMHRIRLRAQNGKDLGHVTLFMKPDQAKLLNGRTIKLAKLNHPFKDAPSNTKVSAETVVTYQIAPMRFAEDALRDVAGTQRELREAPVKLGESPDARNSSKEMPRRIPGIDQDKVQAELDKPVGSVPKGTQSKAQPVELPDIPPKKPTKLSPQVEKQKPQRLVEKVCPTKKFLVCNRPLPRDTDPRKQRPDPPKASRTVIYPVKVKKIRSEIPHKPREEIRLKEEISMGKESVTDEQDPLAGDRLIPALPANENIQKITITVTNNPVKRLADENPVLASFLKTPANSANQIRIINATTSTPTRETNLSLLDKAMNSIADKALREKALKALEDCGVHLERRPPVPAKPSKLVTDSSMQTEVFSLLEEGTFILAKEKSPGLQRVPQRVYLTPDLPSQSISKPITQNAEVQAGPANVEADLLFVPKSPGSNESVDLDGFFHNLSAENSEACKVKDALSPQNRNVTERLAVQLQRDFESIKMYGDDGMLGIHRAVINNNLPEVQRLLMVLKACQDDANVETASGMTCLELAVSSFASAEIVLALLKAGASPVSARLVHDSAIILACKQSSSHLKDLISYVTQPFLLNLTGPEGFNALHYCAMSGNLEGVRALLDAGANMNMRDSRSGRTAIFHAVENNHVKISALLHERGAALTTPNFSGQTVISLLQETTNSRLKKTFGEVVKPGQRS